MRSPTRAGSIVAVLTALACQPSVAQFGPLPPAMCRADDERVEVLLIGSYHMSNPGMDQFNLEADDVLVPKRQQEIQSLVDRLTGFGATRVAVEAPWGDTVATTRYNNHVAGNIELRRSEEEQIGFRLAKQLGHPTVYAIDVRMMLDDEALGPVIGANPEFMKNMQRLEETGQAAMHTMGDWLASGTVGEMLYNMNDPGMIPYAHQPYIEVFVPMVAGDSYAGADMVATWYQRNLRIFANLTRITESSDDRIFVIYGAGHVPILRDLIEAHPDYCIEDPLPYLK